MKKLIYRYSRLIAGAIVLSAVVSCSDSFLNEELIRERNYDYFSTTEGLVDAATATYIYYKTPFTAEWNGSITTYGTDEFDVGGDNSNHDWNDYTANLSPSVITINSNTTRPEQPWNHYYKAIGLANLILSRVESTVSNQALKEKIKGEAAFSRAFCYLNLVEQFGGVPLKLEPSEGVDKFFIRASKEECVNQVIADFRVAYENLPEKESEEGRLYKDVAAHYLAKALLYRTSEINDDWNSAHKTSDLAEIVQLTNVVIANHTLAPDFKNVFDFTVSDGANEKLSEVLFAAQFSNATTAVEGNQMHLFFAAKYDNVTGGTRDIAGGRPYQRYKTSGYIYDVYDLKNDSRFWKSFKTKINLNNKSAFGQLAGKDPVTGNSYTYGYGDLSIIYLINSKTDLRFDKAAAKVNSKHTGVYYYHPQSSKVVPHAHCLWYSDGTSDLASLTNRSFYPTLNKHFDGSRPNHNYTGGARDGILARLSETYLIKAEALIRQQKFSEALNEINIVRERAQFKAGEDRAAYTDGSAAYLTNTAGQLNYPDGILVNSFSASNSYYESLLIPETTESSDLTNGITVGKLPSVDEAIIAKLGYTSDYDRMMCFLLNERSRELVGEFQRWQDLARTKTLIKRVQAFNSDGAPNIQEKHFLRPIPQSYLDAITNENGIPLTPEEKNAMQNPGY
jgi:starch-binding outer membrane protein, SusD/RagB family